MVTETIVRCDIHGETAPEDDNDFDRIAVHAGHFKPLITVDYCGETDRHELIREISTRLHQHADEFIDEPDREESEKALREGVPLQDVVTVEPGEVTTHTIEPKTRHLL